MTPMTSTEVLRHLGTERLPLVHESEHFAYTGVSILEYPACHLALISSGTPIGFGDMGQVFGQIEEHDDFVDRHDLKRAVEAPIQWLYHNEADQPPCPDGNPVRPPFLFEAGYAIEPPPEPLDEASPEFGKFITRSLRPLRVASLVYRGSFPHQENSGFVDASQTLSDGKEAQGHPLTRRLYRELYHVLDWDDPTGSVTEIQVEIESD